MQFLLYFASIVDQFDPRVALFLENFRDEHVPLRLSFAIFSVFLLLLLALFIWTVVVCLRILSIHQFEGDLGLTG